MKKLISTGLLLFTLCFSFGVTTIPYTAQAQGVTLQQIVRLFISLGIIPANKVAAAEAAVGIASASTSISQTISSSTPSAVSTSTATTSQGVITASTCTAEGQKGYDACVSPCENQNNMCVFVPPTPVATTTCEYVNNVCVPITQLEQEGISVTYHPSLIAKPALPIGYPIRSTYVPSTSTPVCVPLTSTEAKNLGLTNSTGYEECTNK